MNSPTRRLVPVAALAVAIALSAASCSGSGSDDGAGARPSVVSTITTTDRSTGTSTPMDGATPTTSEPEAVVGALQLCEDAVVNDAGAITDGQLSEISGVVASRSQPSVLWVHNDSGHPNEVWAIDHEGAVQGRFTVAGATSVDWEDIALGAGPAVGESYLYVGDIGDNASTPVIGRGATPRSAETTPVVIYRVPEPAASPTPDGGSSVARTTEPAVAFPVEYADGPRDAEALLADPVTGDVFVISKQWDGSPTGLYRLPAEVVEADAAPAETTIMERVADVAGSDAVAGPGLITGADISPDGTLVALRTYGSVILWDRHLDATVAETLSTPPTCTRPLVEPQGEAVAFAPASDALVTISEGDASPLNWLRLPNS